ncbi:MAG: hypothetical protein ACSLE0_13720, partial [Chitinophagaceae bacterium]
MYNKEKGTYRTEKANSLFAEIPPLVQILEENKKAILKKIALNRVLCKNWNRTIVNLYKSCKQ